MRKLLYSLMVMIGLSVPNMACAETIHATVNGLVCGFCATGIEKTFKEQAAVDSVVVDLDKKIVDVKIKSGQQMDDAMFTKLITDAGYNVVSIARNKS